MWGKVGIVQGGVCALVKFAKVPSIETESIMQIAIAKVLFFCIFSCLHLFIGLVLV
jgi:hypothetical protein